MNEFDLLFDLHRYDRRQGPGSSRDTQRAIELTGLRDRRNLEIADIGCGTGYQSEMDAYQKYSSYYSYGFYIARKR